MIKEIIECLQKNNIETAKGMIAGLNDDMSAAIKQEFIELGNNIALEQAFINAARYGDMGVLRFLFKNATQEQQQAMLLTDHCQALSCALKYAHTEIVEFLLNNAVTEEQREYMLYKQDQNTLVLAAIYGRVEVRRLVA